jgi:hypothetical protein
MRVNVYAEEMTDRIEIISKTIEGKEFTGLRLYLELPVTLPRYVYLSGPTPQVGEVYFERPTEETRNVKGPFMHRPGDDDSAAVTFWGKRDLRDVLRKALDLLDTHYMKRQAERVLRNSSYGAPPEGAGSPPQVLARTKHAPKTMQYSDAPCQPRTCILTCLCETEIRSDTWEGVGAAFDEHLKVVSKKETPHADIG